MLQVLISELLLRLHQLLYGRCAGHPAEQIPINRTMARADFGRNAGAFNGPAICEVQCPRAIRHKREVDVDVLALAAPAVDALRSAEVPLQQLSHKDHIGPLANRVALRRGVELADRLPLLRSRHLRV